MASTISKPVGEGGATGSRDRDVKKVAELLNAVDPARGGPSPKLNPAGFTPWRLTEAITAFQMHHFACSNGRVDPTGATLDLLLAAGVTVGPHPVRVRTMRQRAETVTHGRRMVGRTSYEPVDEHGLVIDPTALRPGKNPADRERYRAAVRRGWQALEEIYRAAGLDYPAWQFQKFDWTRSRTPGGIGWCGVYCTWALVQAGHRVRYVLGKGISHDRGGKAGPRLPLHAPTPGKWPTATLGDVCVVKDTNAKAVTDVNPKGYLFHHVLMASEPDAAGNFEALEGNFPDNRVVAQCIVDRATSYKPVRNLSELFYWYNAYQPAFL